MSKDITHWWSLKNQGKILNILPFCDMSVSNQHLRNLKLSDKLTSFIVKARLNLLEVNLNLATWYPHLYTKRCHLCNQPEDTVSHVLNGCPSHQSYYIDRHSRTVRHLLSQIEKQHPTWECLCEVPITDNRMNTEGVFIDVVCNKPDILVIDRDSDSAYIIEVSHPYDAFINICYQSKFDKYIPLCNALASIGLHSSIIVLIISSSGLVHNRFVSGLKLVSLSRAKDIAKYLSISVMIGSRRVWKKRFDFNTIDNRLLNQP